MEMFLEGTGVFVSITHTKSDPIGQLNYLSVILSGFGIAFEQPHKRVEITLYCIPKTLEAIWNYLEKRNLVMTIPF